MSAHGGKPAWRRHFWLDYSAGGSMPYPGRGVWFAAWLFVAVMVIVDNWPA